MTGKLYSEAVEGIRSELMALLREHGQDSAVEAAVGTLIGATSALAAIVGPRQAARAVMGIAGELAAQPREPEATVMTIQ